MKKKQSKEYRRQYYLKNKERILKVKKLYREKNKEKLLASWRAYYKRNAKRLNQLKIKYRNKVYKNNPSFRIYTSVRTRILKFISGKYKSSSTSKLLGCSIEELWQHLESKFQPGMTRSNHGEWHIDHIRPCASFDLSDPEQQKICFHYTNLQPLWAVDNLKKGARLNYK